MGPARFSALLSEAVTWCDRITLCLAAPRSEHGTVEAWAALLAARAKYDRVIVSDAAAAEGWLLHRLHETSALRLIEGPSRRFEDQLLHFQRGGEVQLLLARTPLTGASSRGECGPVVHFRGESTEDFALSFQELIERWREAARVPTGSELDALTTATGETTATIQVPASGASLGAVTERRALFAAIAQVFATRLGGQEEGPSGEENSSDAVDSPHAEVPWTGEQEGWRMSLVRLSDGVRVELSDGGPSPPVELVLRAADSTNASNALLLSDASGSICLAWRGGLIGSSEKKNQTLWSQCRLPTLEVEDSGAGDDDKVHRVALVARTDQPLEPQLAAFAREVRRLQELLAPRGRNVAKAGYSDFLRLGSVEQGACVWGYLIGLGALPLDEAVRVCAQALREDGHVRYQRLRRDGALYELLWDVLKREASAGGRFDSPAPGLVRAVQPDLESYERDDWLDCLVNALPEGDILDRAAAMRLIFNYARENWGLAAQRLRSGGKSEKALKSALNSAIRRGLLRRIGAAYVEKVTARTEAQRESMPAAASAAAWGGLSPSAQTETLPIASNLTDLATPSEVSKTDAAADSGLNRSLNELVLPVRASNWADRKGLVTLRDLVAWHPDAFVAEPNVGRLTVAETRMALEAALGREWEEIWSELDGPKVAPPARAEAGTETSTGPLPSAESSRWNRRRAELSEAQLHLPLNRLDLPARMRGFCEQRSLSTVGELLALPRDELLAQPNLGRGSLLQTLEALDEALLDLEQPHRDDHLLAGWRRLLQRLPPLERMILVRRSGSYGPRETLESLGETLGLTRERVRQIEARCLDNIRERSMLVASLEERLRRAFVGGRCVPLDLLLQDDPWWRGIDRHPDCADYLFERLLGSAVHRVELEQGDRVTTFYARFTPREVEQAKRDLLSEAAKVTTPAHLTDYEPLLERVVQTLDPAMRETFEAVLEEQLNFDDADPERVLSFGNTKPDRVIALLASQPQPMPVSAVFDALGRCRLPDEVLYFRRGVVGLEQHFPEFRAWMERLVPSCIEMMTELPAGRQWLVTELHDSLREAGKLPEWLGHWHLASLLRRSGQVHYLGRLRVSLSVEGHRQERLHLSDAVLTVLQAAGAPLPSKTIAERVRQQTDIHDLTLKQLLLSSPFVRVEEDLYGLIERDVSGGSQAIARAVEAVVEELATRQRGLTMYQAYQIATAEAGERWSQELVSSLLRSEPQLRLSRSGHVGLSSWDDVRATTRGEFIRQQTERAGGRLEVAGLQRALRDTYGRELDGSELASECHRNQLQLDGDVIVLPANGVGESLAAKEPARDVTRRPSSAASSDASFVVAPSVASPQDLPAPSNQEPPPTVRGTSGDEPDALVDLRGRVQGLPAAARQHFEELLQQPLQAPLDLLERARAHLADIEAAGHHNEFIDISLAKTLLERMQRLLERVEALSPITRRIAQAAVLYFISTEDAEDDFDLGGLEDDEAVLSAVIAHLELS